MRWLVHGGVLLMVLLAASAAQAGVYKWTDANGRVHYSSSPPPGGQAEQVRIRSAPASSEADTPAPAAAPAEEQGAGETAEPTSARETFAKNCEIARQNLTVLQDPKLTVFRQDGGKPVRYDEEQRKQQIAAAQAQVQQWCLDRPEE